MGFGSVNIIGLLLACCERHSYFISSEETVTKECPLCQSPSVSGRTPRFLHSDEISQLNVPANSVCASAVTLPLTMEHFLFISFPTALRTVCSMVTPCAKIGTGSAR